MLHLGSRLNMLTRVRLDLDQSCPVDCHAGHGSTSSDFIFFDARYAVLFGSLVKLLWANPGLLLSIAFVHPQGQSHYDCHPGNDPLQRQTGLQVSALTMLLSTFSNDPLEIKKYSCQIREIMVNRDCLGGYVLFCYGCQGFEASVKKHFRICDGGTNMVFEDVPKHNLMQLPSHIKDQIFRLAMHVSPLPQDCQHDHSTLVCHDLDKKTTNSSAPQILAVCAELR
jgi:hypothetical protein